MLSRLLAIVTIALAAALPCGAASVQSQLSAIERQCAECGVKGRAEIAPIDSLMHLPASKVSRAAVLEASYRTMSALNRSQLYSACMRLGTAIVPMFSEDLGTGNDELQSYIYLLDELGSACNAMGMQSQLCDTYIKALNIARSHGMKAEEAILLNNMGTVYQGMGDYRRAVDCLNQAIKINESRSDAERLFVNYNNLSGCMVAQGQFDKGLELAYLALHQLDGANKPDMEMLMQRNICSIYRKKGQTRMALDMLRGIISYQLAHHQNAYLTDSYRLAGALYADAHMTDSALISYRQALNINGESTQIEQRIMLLGAIARMWALKGDHAQAYESMRQLTALRDSLDRIQYAGNTRVISNLYDNEQHSIGQMASMRKWNTGLWWTLGLMTLALVVLVMLYRRVKRRAADYKIEAEKQNAAQLEQRLHEAEQHHAEQQRTLTERIQQLETEARHTASQSLTQSLAATRNAEYVAAINEQLKATLLKLNPKNTEARAKVRQLIALADGYGDSGIDEFSEVFNKVYPSFFDHLFERYGDLTPKELRLCALLRLGLSTKTIADITFREVRSVESARNRLRKKFGLQQQDNLVSFLHQF